MCTHTTIHQHGAREKSRKEIVFHVARDKILGFNKFRNFGFQFHRVILDGNNNCL